MYATLVSPQTRVDRYPLTCHASTPYCILWSIKLIVFSPRRDKGITALHMASSTGKEGNMKLLLGHVADVDVRTDDGVTPLLFGLERCGSDTTTRLLLDGGANLNARDVHGHAAIHCFAKG